jgi:hypothetical protein
VGSSLGQNNNLTTTPFYAHTRRWIYRGAYKSLARHTSPSIVFSVQGTGGSRTGPDPENRVDDQDIGSPGRPVSSRLQVPSEPFPSWSDQGLISTTVVTIVSLNIL